MAEIKKCDCAHDYQDEKYGSGNRVHNSFEKNSQIFWRCTVCAKEKNAGIVAKKKEKKEGK